MSIEHRDQPSAEYRFFVYDALNGDFSYYRSAEDRDKSAESVIQSYLDDAWDETVEQVVAGEMTHFCSQVDREDRPAESELNEEKCDRAGKHWGEWEYTCDYALLPLVAPKLRAYWVADYDVFAAQDEAQALALANAMAASAHTYTKDDVRLVLDVTLDEPLASDAGPTTLRQMLATAEPGYLAGYDK